MTGAAARRWRTDAPEQTEALARRFALTAPTDADRAVVVYLRGELGAGKTTWARGFLLALGADRVRSPTYALLEIYALVPLTVSHLDLYRLAGGDEVEALGLRDLDAPAHLWLIEWPERGGAAIPKADLELELTLEGDGRRITAAARSPLGAAWLARNGEPSLEVSMKV